MSWSSHRRALATLALVATLATGLGACSFSPVYSGALAANPTLDIAYAKPASRLEQIIYQELALRLGSSTSATAALAKVSVSASGPSVGLMTSAPGANTMARVTITATLTLAQQSAQQTPPLTIIRSATADYTTSGQVLANTTAATEATERAARAAAESLRLALLAALSRR